MELMHWNKVPLTELNCFLCTIVRQKGLFFQPTQDERRINNRGLHLEMPTALTKTISP